jgi:hypothetical protein
MKDELIETLKVMVSLLEDPCPGLSSWHEACEATALHIEVLLSNARSRSRLIKQAEAARIPRIVQWAMSDGNEKYDPAG